MHFILFPKKDAVIYSKYPNRNYGLDPILELKAVANSTSSFDNTRILLKFDVDYSIFPANTKFYLNLFTSRAYNLTTDYTIEVYAVSKSWDMGTGLYTDSTAVTDGVSWTKRTRSINWDNEGSDYISNSKVSQDYTYDGSVQSIDLRIDVTSIVAAWSSSIDYTNNGFLIKRPDAAETGSIDYGNLIFYSTDSHTTYLPTLEAAWDDSSYVTGSTQISTLVVLSGSLTEAGQIVGNLNATGMLTQTGQLDVKITGSESGHIEAYTYIESSSISSAMNNVVVGYFEGLYSGSIIGYFSGSMTASLVTGSITSSYLSGSIDGSGSLSGSYIGNYSPSISGSISGSVTASMITTGSITNYTGSIYLYVSGTLNGYLVGSASNATIYYYQSASGVANFTGSMTGSSTGIFSGSYSGSVNGTVSGSAFISGSFRNIMAGKSFEALHTDEMSIVLKNLKAQYKYQSRIRIRMAGKDTYQRKTFLNTAASEFQIIKYLPMSTYYSIVDSYTNRTIIPFSDYTKISCDLSGNYFNLDLHGFMPERFYKIIFKSVVDETDVYIDNNYTFKVVK